MNVALMGSVSSSWYALDALIRSGVEITGVLGVDESQAERISDYRSLRRLATDAALPFLSFVKVSEPEVETFLCERAPDMLWVIGISQLVPDRLINIARYCGLGFHPTMLPEGRGRAPVAWTILKNARAAVSLFVLTHEADAGDLIAQREVAVKPDDYSEELIERTNHVLSEVVLELAPLIKSGSVPRVPQDHSKATHYEKRTPADGVIDWHAPTEAVYRLVRAAGRPYPGAFTHGGGNKVTIWRAQPCEVDVSDGSSPGQVLANDASGVLIRTGDAALRATEVEADGGLGVLEVGMRLK